MRRWLLVDYGEVISAPQSSATLSQLAAIAGQEPAALRDRYWAHRRAYDLGQSDVDYWSEVLGDDLSRQAALVERLVSVDIAGWMTLNDETVAVLHDYAARSGAGLALLSNAPRPLASAIEASDWAQRFEHRFYSCRLGQAKPDPGVYQTVLGELPATPASVLFVDDRRANTQAAAALGMAVVTFSSAESLRRHLDGWSPT